MKEELLKNLAGIFEYVKQGAYFVKEQAPLFIQEFITFKIWLYCFYIIVSIVLLISSIFVFKKGYEIYKKDEYDCTFIFFVAIGSVGAIIAFVVFYCSSEELMKAYFAPRYFLMEHLLSLGK